MSTTRLVDSATVSTLAALDPCLADCRTQPWPPLGAPGAILDDVRWTPGERLRLAYRVQDGTPRFIAVQVDVHGRSEFDFRMDPELPGLGQAADPGVMSSLLAPHLDDAVVRCAVQPVRYRPGSRCVLRYDIETERRRLALYGKCVRPDHYDRLAERSTHLAARPGASRLVAPLVATMPDLQTVVSRAVEGRSVSALLADATLPVAARISAARRVGELLARFHAQVDPGAPTWSTSEQIAGLERSLKAVRAVDPPLADRLTALVDDLVALMPADTTPVLGHGGFRAGQIISGPDAALTLLDTDGACLSDAGRDIGAALSHLTWQAVRLPAQRDVLGAAERALLAGYEACGGPLDRARVRWWTAAALVQVAARRYSRLESVHWPLVPALVDLAADMLDSRPRRDNSRRQSQRPHRELSALISTALASNAVEPPVTVESSHELRVLPGRRSLVLYRVRGLDRGVVTAIIGKSFTEAYRARLLYEHLRLLTEGPFRDGDLRVPEPLALLPEHHLVLFRACSGVALDRLFAGPQAEGGVRRAALWAARLHGSDVTLPRLLSMAREQESTQQWAALVAQLDPGLGSSARLLADGWARGVAPAPGGGVPIHKDLHAAHVMAGRRLSVIDLDEARMGDRTFDVAHFCAYLGLAPAPRREQQRLQAAFLDEYAAATGWSDPGTYAPFSAYAWLKIAKQFAVGSGPGAGVPPQERRGRAAAALQEGCRWLTA